MIINLLPNLYKIRKTQWLKTSDIERIQQKRLRAIIKHAYNNVPYYHKLFDSVKIKPEDIKSSDDLSKIPITTKSKLFSSGNEVIAKNLNMSKCVTEWSSGSSGMPINIIRLRGDKDYFNAVLYREFLENGLKFRDKRVAITSERVFSSGNYWFRRLGILRKICLSVFDDPEDIISSLLKSKPDVISGYPSTLKLLATVIAEKGIEEINPRLIFTHAELLDNDTRKTINSVFGVKLSDLYGCMEVGPISWQCSEHEDYHMNIDYAVVEFITDGERSMPGEKGEIVLTGLYSFAMPFIRYNVGDVGIPTNEMCSCGRGLPMMKSIEGRLVDFIVLLSGRLISPHVLTGTTENIPGIQRFQVVQEKRNLITFRFIKNKTFTRKTISIIKEEYKKILGNDVEINPISVTELQKDESGKFKVVKSLVSTRSSKLYI